MAGEDEQVEQHSTVDEATITRNSTMGGMWDGMRKGALVGGIAMAGLLGVGMFVGVAAASGLMTVSGGPASIGSMFGPKGMLIGGVLSAVTAAAGIITGAAIMPSLLTIAGVGLAVVAGAAAIGAVVGAVNGYAKSDDAIEIAKDAEHMSHERKQVGELQSQQKERQLQLAEAKLMMERERMKAGAGQHLAGAPHGLPPEAAQLGAPGKGNMRGSGGIAGN